MYEYLKELKAEAKTVGFSIPGMPEAVSGVVEMASPTRVTLQITVDEDKFTVNLHPDQVVVLKSA